MRSSSTAHVSFLSPPIESIVQLPSYSSITSSLPPFSSAAMHPFPSSASALPPFPSSVNHSKPAPYSDPSDPYSLENLTRTINAFTSDALNTANTSFQLDHHQDYLKHLEKSRPLEISHASSSRAQDSLGRPQDVHRSIPSYMSETLQPSSLPTYLSESKQTVVGPNFMTDKPLSSLPFHIQDHQFRPDLTSRGGTPGSHHLSYPPSAGPLDPFRSNSQASYHGSIASIPASLPPFPSTSLPHSFPSELSIASLPTNLNQAAAKPPTAAAAAAESLVLLKKDDLESFLSKARQLSYRVSQISLYSGSSVNMQRFLTLAVFIENNRSTRVGNIRI